MQAQAPTFSENGEGSVEASGWAKKHPKDEPDQQIGYNVAMARALRALADEYDKRAEELMATPALTVDNLFTPEWLTKLKAAPYTISYDGGYGRPMTTIY